MGDAMPFSLRDQVLERPRAGHPERCRNVAPRFHEQRNTLPRQQTADVQRARARAAGGFFIRRRPPRRIGRIGEIGLHRNALFVVAALDIFAFAEFGQRDETVDLVVPGLAFAVIGDGARDGQGLERRILIAAMPHAQIGRAVHAVLTDAALAHEGGVGANAAKIMQRLHRGQARLAAGVEDGGCQHVMEIMDVHDIRAVGGEGLGDTARAVFRIGQCGWRRAACRRRRRSRYYGR